MPTQHQTAAALLSDKASPLNKRVASPGINHFGIFKRTTTQSVQILPWVPIQTFVH